MRRSATIGKRSQLRRLERQTHNEAGAKALDTIHIDRAVVLLDDLPRARQTDASPLNMPSSVASTAEALENMRQIFDRNADALIGHFDLRPRLLFILNAP